MSNVCYILAGVPFTFAELINQTVIKMNCLPIVIGHTPNHEPRVIDLADAPHILVAGASGQEISVFLHNMAESLQSGNSPEKLKLVFIERTSSGEAADTLAGLCEELERRYEALSSARVSSVRDYHRKAGSGLPYIVCIIEEFGGMGAAAIIRLAQMGRAAGIHMIIATQRLSPDVITSLIKANFPTKIAFRTASSKDSIAILDNPGAEKLSGKGDFLLGDEITVERISS